MAPATAHKHAESTGAMDCVLNTFELFETILLYLPLVDLLLAQRISRSTRDLIQSSTPIQKALFFQPLNLKQNPADTMSAPKHSTNTPADGAFRLLPLNPFLSKLGVEFQVAYERDPAGASAYFTWSNPAVRLTIKAVQMDSEYLSASFRKMLLIQEPPPPW